MNKTNKINFSCTKRSDFTQGDKNLPGPGKQETKSYIKEGPLIKMPQEIKDSGLKYDNKTPGPGE